MLLAIIWVGLGSILAGIELVKIKNVSKNKTNERLQFQFQQIKHELKLNTSQIAIVIEMNVSYLYIVSWYQPRLPFEFF
jgi:hypothetical protein